MIDKEFLEALSSDVKIIATRIFEGKQVSAFGVDGNGEHGTNYHGSTFSVSFILAGVFDHSDVSDPEGFIAVGLDKYDHKACGHIFTDQNLRISINKLFSDELVDVRSWSWGTLEEQGGDFFVIRLNVNRFLDW